METALAAFRVDASIALYSFAIVALAAETVFLVVTRRPRDKQSRWLGIRCGALSFGTGAAFSFLFAFPAQLWLYEHRLFDLGFGWHVWLLCFLISDLMFYVSHRLEHSCRALWAVHVVHHSSRHYDLTAGVRGSVLDAFVHFPFTAWLPLLGIHPLIVVILETCFRFYGLGYHTELIGKLGILDGIFVTPSNHRVHHGVNHAYLDRNYGGFFILFDRAFGTYTRETERVRYGLVKDWHGYDTVDAQLHELRDLARDVRAASGLRAKLRVLLQAPSAAHTAHSTSSPSAAALP